MILLLACADPPVAEMPEADDPAFVAPFHGEPLAAPALLRRASLDLRGVVPTEAELDAVEADPAALDALVEGFLDDPRYEERLVDLFAERWLTRADVFNVLSRDYDLPAEKNFEYLRAVGEEPLRLMAHVGTRDEPWTSVVTADYTMANDLLGSIWPLTFLEDGEGWRKARYTDDRPAGGVVMTNGLWWRYYTTPNNYNRTRAAALSRLLLCEDFLLRPIQFEAAAILDRASLNEAIRTVPACVGCHDTLDPLASSLFGFWWFDIYTPAELHQYHPEREYLGEYYLDGEMAYFGAPMDGAADLGGLLAEDPRFLTCTVRSMAEGLWRRPVGLDDFTVLDGLRTAFLDGDLRLDALVTAILRGDDYRVGALADTAGPTEETTLTTRRVLSPEQLESAVADLTGFTWRADGYDQLTNDVIGYRVLAGGVDGLNVTSPEREPTLTQALVLKRLAQASAQHSVEYGTLVSEAERAQDSPDPAVLVRLHRRFLGAAPDAVELAAIEALWAEVAAVSGRDQAWASVIAVLLRDPAFWTY